MGIKRKRAGRRAQNLEFAFPRRRTDPKPGAGRPRSSTRVSHLSREAFRRQTPVHVTLRVSGSIPSLRRKRAYRVIRSCFERSRNDGFQVVRHSVQGNHLHLIVEASSKNSLSRGMQGLGIRLAKRLNDLFGRVGRFFSDRYHAHLLRSPREVRNAINYVLKNRAKHRSQAGLGPLSLRDPCSSQTHDVAPRTWLLRVGWTVAT